ncbi:hypothetical protein CPT_Musica_045 [Burkholderia phage Musica]|uniref:Uncharacterized protein n=1 Tax=Burkholderia phage Musica TaxID=2924903 RepID=A0AAE9K4P2_9CAUD|nr:hypothetical protein CPT_Musica_045 [Burkholderia phage Musica]
MNGASHGAMSPSNATGQPLESGFYLIDQEDAATTQARNNVANECQSVTVDKIGRAANGHAAAVRGDIFLANKRESYTDFR